MHTGNSAHDRKELSAGTTRTSGLCCWAVCHPLTGPRPGCSRDSPGTLLSRPLMSTKCPPWAHAVPTLSQQSSLEVDTRITPISVLKKAKNLGGTVPHCHTSTLPHKQQEAPLQAEGVRLHLLPEASRNLSYPDGPEHISMRPCPKCSFLL